MANRAHLLEARVRQLDAAGQRILEAGRRRHQPPRQIETWWPFLVGFDHTEEGVFTNNHIDRRVFNEALSLVSNIPVDRRGRPGAIRSPRECLLFLFIYLASGVGILECLVFDFIKKRETIHKTAQRIGERFLPNLVEGLVRFGNEEVGDVPEAALVVDCTVCQIKRPKQPFDEAKVYFSGKHSIYCLKKEVFVNIRSGTAALISKSYPGATHDMAILSSHPQEVRDLIGDRKV